MLTREESTYMFYGVSKLFVSADASLRRMTYLFLKDFAASPQNKCYPQDLIMVISCLLKDFTCNVDLYRANLVRVLTQIGIQCCYSTPVLQGMDGWDIASLTTLEQRFLKPAIVDQSQRVSSAALVSACHFLETTTTTAAAAAASNEASSSLAIVRRWNKEIQEVAHFSPHPMVQFHALQLLVTQIMVLPDSASSSSPPNHYLYHHQQQLHNAMTELVSQYVCRPMNQATLSVYMNNNKKSPPLALIVLIRCTVKLLVEEYQQRRQRGDSSYYDYFTTANNSGQQSPQVIQEGYQVLVASLQHPSPMVAYEAARAICNLHELLLGEIVVQGSQASQDEQQKKDLDSAMNRLKDLSHSSKPAIRYAAGKLLQGL
mmetsp:Transcript_106/g.222  ORF Transcript_106/g.222 Transcript_106/m.222 type:complete len:373 (+) Transcript_106:1-1119(+)